jgi:hypothetical protein
MAYIDYSSQEFGIAAALSGDKRMLEAYESGDVLGARNSFSSTPLSREPSASGIGAFEAAHLVFELGVRAVRGRSYLLRINYRTSHQIRVQADRLLPPALADVDGNAEDRHGTVSVFNGPAPEIETFDDPEQESRQLVHGSRAGSNREINPTRSRLRPIVPRASPRARAAVKRAGIPTTEP